VFGEDRVLGAGGELQLTKRGWMGGIGGCPNVGGICIGCTMPGFPDKFMPFMDEPPGAKFSSSLIKSYGVLIRGLRAYTASNVNHEAKWHHRGTELTTGYHPNAGNGFRANNENK
jgi:hydrogenase small subunit